MPTAGNARVVDAYPTRVAQAPASLTQPRQDGVVKGRALPGPLSEAQLDEFERKGYLFIPNLIDGEELEALRKEMNALLSNDAYRDKAFSITEPESHEIRSLFAVHRLSERLGALASDERVAGAARQSIGDDPYGHQSRINYKPGFAVAMMLKDLRLAMGAGDDVGADTPLGNHAQQIYAKLDEDGFGDIDFSGVMRRLKGEL